MNITDLQGTVTLRNGTEMPYVGLGVFQMSNGIEVVNAVNDAIAAGYRHIDTASLYGNEKGVAQGIQKSGVDRKNIFVTTKVWNSDQGYEKTFRAFDESMKRLGFDYIDLYLIHWPVKGKFNETWKAVEKLYSGGRVRAIGVSNFLQHHLEELLPHCTETPMVNQMEFHPYLLQQDLVDFCRQHSIQYEAWSPLMQGRILSVPELRSMAKKYNKSVPQIVIRWSLQKGVVTIPKSSHRPRIIENANVFDFKISAEDMRAIDALDRHERVGPDPDTFDF